MTCPACMQWCATTEAQLAIRMKNITGAPEVQPHPCPSCHGTDWAISRKMIKEEAPRSRLSSWMRPTPMWSAVLHFMAAFACIAYAIYLGPSWQGTVNAGVGGFNLAGGIYTVSLIRQRRLLFEGQDLLDTAMTMNRALLSDKVHVVMGNIHDDDDASIAPDRLH